MRVKPRFLTAAATCSILLSMAAAGDAAASSKVRFLHAVPGAPSATLTVSGGSGPRAAIRDITFAKPSASVPGPSGSVDVTLTVGGKQVAAQREQLGAGGSYTIVAEKGSGDALRFEVYRAGRAKAGAARLRAVHAAPEVGRVDMTVGRRSWGSVSYGQTTGYESARPGTYTVAARKAGDPSPLIQARGLNVTAGTAATAYAVGSAGMASRLVLVQDSVAAPTSGPHTGLGGIAPDSSSTPWLTALLAALAAGGLGAFAFVRAPRRGRGRA